MLSLLAFAVAASPMRSIQEFGVLPTNSPDRNRAALQTAIDWASVRAVACFDKHENLFEATLGR